MIKTQCNKYYDIYPSIFLVITNDTINLLTYDFLVIKNYNNNEIISHCNDKQYIRSTDDSGDIIYNYYGYFINKAHNLYNYINVNDMLYRIPINNNIMIDDIKNTNLLHYIHKIHHLTINLNLCDDVNILIFKLFLDIMRNDLSIYSFTDVNISSIGSVI